MTLADFSTSIWSILPPLLALSLAIVTRRVLLSLSAGIIVGALMLNNGSVYNSGSYILSNVTSIVYADGGINYDYVNIIIFLFLLGIITALLTISGSNQAFAIWAQKHIKQRRGAKLLAAFLGIFIFIDDYFNSLAVGAISRPVTDKFKVSRAKLAYILDSTAAPMCVIMPISSWGAYIITLVAGLLTTYSITEYTPMGAFIAMSAMNYYAIFALIMVLLVSFFSIDIGPMAKSEAIAMSSDELVDSDFDTDGREGHVANLLLPIITLVFATIGMMMYTGNASLAADGKEFTILGAFENTSVGISLVVGALASLGIATVLILGSRHATFQEYLVAYYLGIKSMIGAILVLFFAWTINSVVGDIQTGKFLSTLITGNLAHELLPAVLFVLAAVMAFSTGTSWGTFGIMLPIGAAIAADVDPMLFLPCLSAVMAGAVCGDHCSPISDTTILSSTGAKCEHIEHVRTQLPYALIVALASVSGYLVVGYTKSPLFGFITASVVLAVIVLIFRARQSNDLNVTKSTIA